VGGGWDQTHRISYDQRIKKKKKKKDVKKFQKNLPPKISEKFAPKNK
jgi:hypothetical protein